MLVNGGTNFNGKTINLGADIDLGSSNWTPIGKYLKEYHGNFDGGGHIISNLRISATSSEGSSYGLFGEISGGTVKNVGLSGVSINVISAANSLCVGGLAGNTDGAIVNCFVTGSISGTVTHSSVYFGGLVGRNSFGTVNNCYTTAAVSVSGSGTYSVGGLAGYNMKGSISYSYWLSTATAEGIGSGSNPGTGNSSFTDTNLLVALNTWLDNVKREDLYTWVSSESYPVFGPLWTPPTYTVSGTVLNGSTGLGVPGLRVDLYASTDGSVSKGYATTNELGDYEISGVPAGSYVARVAAAFGSHAQLPSATPQSATRILPSRP